LRHLAPDKAIAGRPGLRNNASIGGAGMNQEDRPMPPLVVFAGFLGGLAVVRWAYRTALQVNHELEEARLARSAQTARSNDIPTLRQDPVTGAYRPG
jgi:hypothetical protein